MPTDSDRQTSALGRGTTRPSAQTAERGVRSGDKKAALILLAPMLVLFSLCAIYPLVETLRLSLFDIRGLRAPEYVGFGNYIKLLSDQTFLRTIGTTLIFTFSVTALTVAIGWVLAMLCAFAPRETWIFRLMIFATFGISEAVSAYVWIGIFRPDAGGMLNAVIGLFRPGFAHPWLGDQDTALWAIVAAATWSGVGLPLMLCFASVQSISRSILEAAYIDGAKPTSIMRHIMMPLSLPGVRVAVFINLVGALRAFDIIFILTNGGPLRSTETIGFFMFRESMTQFKLGYGAAVTVVLLVGVLIVSVPAITKRTAAVL